MFFRFSGTNLSWGELVLVQKKRGDKCQMGALFDFWQDWGTSPLPRCSKQKNPVVVHKHVEMSVSFSVQVEGHLKSYFCNISS